MPRSQKLGWQLPCDLAKGIRIERAFLKRETLRLASVEEAPPTAVWSLLPNRENLKLLENVVHGRPCHWALCSNESDRAPRKRRWSASDESAVVLGQYLGASCGRVVAFSKRCDFATSESSAERQASREQLRCALPPARVNDAGARCLAATL